MNQFTKIGVRSVLASALAISTSLSAAIATDPTGQKIQWLVIAAAAFSAFAMTMWSGYKSLDEAPDGKAIVQEHQITAFVPAAQVITTAASAPEQVITIAPAPNARKDPSV